MANPFPHIPRTTQGMDGYIRDADSFHEKAARTMECEIAHANSQGKRVDGAMAQRFFAMIEMILKRGYDDENKRMG